MGTYKSSLFHVSANLIASTNSTSNTASLKRNLAAIANLPVKITASKGVYIVDKKEKGTTPQ